MLEMAENPGEAEDLEDPRIKARILLRRASISMSDPSKSKLQQPTPRMTSVYKNGDALLLARQRYKEQAKEMKIEQEARDRAFQQLDTLTTESSQIKSVVTGNRDLLVENKKMMSNILEVVSAKKEKENQDEAVVIDAYQMKINYLEMDNARLIHSIKKRRSSSRSKAPVRNISCDDSKTSVESLSQTASASATKSVIMTLHKKMKQAEQEARDAKAALSREQMGKRNLMHDYRAIGGDPKASKDPDRFNAHEMKPSRPKQIKSYKAHVQRHNKSRLGELQKKADKL